MASTPDPSVDRLEHAPTAAPEGTPLYVHLPFCITKCRYCDFFSVVADEHDLDGFVDLILREADARPTPSPRTVFLGGGTPSYLRVAQLERLMDGLDERTGFRSSATEVTIECNPESLDEEKARCLVESGATRLSIGIQSLRPETLELFGRAHSAADGIRAFTAARASGADQVSVDLIYAIPGQDLRSWADDLRTVLDLRPDHVSAYNLTFEEGTLFHRWLTEDRIRKTAEDVELAHFAAARELLEGAGYDAYEISNYSLKRPCLHNLNYWKNGAYQGLGPSAVSKLAFTRFGNPRSLEAWSRAVRAGSDARSWSEMPAPLLRLAETWWLGLRLKEGVHPSEARSIAGLPRTETDPCVERAAWLEEQGLLEQEGGRWRLTRTGIPLADGVASDLLGAARAAETTGPVNRGGGVGRTAGALGGAAE